MKNFDMLWQEYQDFCRQGSVYPDAHTGSILEIAYIGLGSRGEEGESIDALKKMVRDDIDAQDIHRPENAKIKEGVIKEFGDLMWYISRATEVLGIGLDEIIVANMEKLTARQNSGEVKWRHPLWTYHVAANKEAAGRRSFIAGPYDTLGDAIEVHESGSGHVLCRQKGNRFEIYTGAKWVGYKEFGA